MDERTLERVTEGWRDIEMMEELYAQLGRGGAGPMARISGAHHAYDRCGRRLMSAHLRALLDSCPQVDTLVVHERLVWALGLDDGRRLIRDDQDGWALVERRGSRLLTTGAAGTELVQLAERLSRRVAAVDLRRFLLATGGGVVWFEISRGGIKRA